MDRTQKMCTSLEDIRKILADKKSLSQTTLSYQADVFETTINCLEEGDCVIEVGVFKGGISCQLAFLLEDTGKTLVLIEVVDEYLQWSKQLIQDIGLTTPATYFNGTLEQFVNAHPDIKPSLIIVDADHSYKGVCYDIQQIKRIKTPPVAAIFHDLSLRYCRGENALRVRIDKALVDAYLMHGYKYQRIGASSRSQETDSRLQRIMTVSAEWGDYHYHDRNSSEGMLVVLNEKKFKRCSPLTWKELEVWSQTRSYSFLHTINNFFWRKFDGSEGWKRVLRKLKRLIAKIGLQE